MKKEDLKKWNKPQIHLQNNLVNKEKNATQTKKIINELNTSQDLYDLSHNLTKISQDKIKTQNIAKIILGTKKEATVSKKYCTYLIEEKMSNKLKEISFKSGKSQSYIINKLIGLL